MFQQAAILLILSVCAMEAAQAPAKVNSWRQLQPLLQEQSNWAVMALMPAAAR